MKKIISYRLFIILMLSLFFSLGCQITNQIVATPKSTPARSPTIPNTPTTTFTPTPTNTSTPTSTPTPTNTSTPTSIPIPTNTLTPYCSQILPPSDVTLNLAICDTFDSNLNQWPIGEYEYSDFYESYNLSNGEYIWQLNCRNNKDGCYSVTYPNNLEQITDFFVAVDLVRVDGPINLEYGIVFRDDGINDYEFMVTDTKKFSVYLWKDNEFLWLSDGPAPMLKPGEVNRLSVQASGTRLTFYINNETVAELEDDGLAIGVVGFAAYFYVSGEAILHADNFELRLP